MAITQVGTASGTGTATGISTVGSITVAVDDIVIFNSSVNQQDTSNRFTAHVLDGTSTATIGTVTNLVNGLGAGGGEISQTVSWARVTGAGTLIGRATLSSTRTVALVVTVLRGASTGATPFTAPASATGNTANPASGTVTPGGAGDWFLGCGAYRQESGGFTVTVTASPSNWTQRVTASTGTGITNAWAGIETWEATDATAYQSAPTVSKTVFWAQVVVALTMAPVSSAARQLLGGRRLKSLVAGSLTR